MDIGFETIGNATLICYDGKPVLVTDPWIVGTPYFGSWALSHEIPPEQFDAILHSQYVWVSHGHPDHLIQDSMNLLRDKTILVPDHYGNRIFYDLKEQGFNVHIIKDKVWTKLSDHVRILCLSDYNQDATLLIDINGRLLVNMNDSSARGWMSFVRRTVKQYPISFYLRLYGGCADMMNFFDENGNRIPLTPRELEPPLGRYICNETEYIGARYFVPFSSFHKLQRKDSVWLQEHIASLEDYPMGFSSKTKQILPAFIRYDCVNDHWRALHPKETPTIVLDPAEFGDDWNDQLDGADFVKAEQYFQAIAHLHEFLDFIRLRVGGKDHVIELSKKRFNRGITFEAPRNSLMTSIEHGFFDDMLIGNFMKTTLHGQWATKSLYPDFSPYVAKYADNGRAKTKKDLDMYFQEYRKRMGIRGVIDLFQHKIEEKSKNMFRPYVSMDSPFDRALRQVYYAVRRN
jgi:hypothetical protein